MAEKKRDENQAVKSDIKAEKSFTKSELEAAIAQAVAKALAEQAKSFSAQGKQEPTILHVKEDERVTLLYIGAIAKGTTVTMPEWGVINLAGGTLSIPKEKFFQGLGNAVNSNLLHERAIIVIDGLTQDEREQFGIPSTNDELTQKEFLQLLDFPSNKLVEIFNKVCDEHKKVIAAVISDAYFSEKDHRINFETIKKLNNASKKILKDGLFIDILEDMAGHMVHDDEEV